ncbi:MAG: pyridoxal-phosphate dependent enzyme, partial [Candidatus Hodgkinia cicadicola]
AEDRIANALIEDALKQTNYDKNTIIIEISSNNAGVGLAAVAASRGLKIVVVVTEDTVEEKLNMLELLGARIIYVGNRIEDAVVRAKDFASKFKSAVIINQFDSLVNVETHRNTTAKEIVNVMGNVDYFVSGVGTGGTITGVGEVLKSVNPLTAVMAVEPWNSSVLSGKQAKSHIILGIGMGFVPSILNMEVIDYIFRAKDNEAVEWARAFAATEGMAVGLSSGAAICASVNLGLAVNDSSKRILMILPSGAERCASTELFNY